MVQFAPTVQHSAPELNVCSPESIVAGTELKIWYGAFTNSQLPMHDGFALEKNPSETDPITLSVPHNDSDKIETKKFILLCLDDSGILSLNHYLIVEKAENARIDCDNEVSG